MKISELKVGQGKVDIEASVADKSSPRQFEKFGKAGKVCDVTGKDASGSIKLTLWNEQVDSVNIGDKIKVTNGYVSEFRGERQLSTGKFGKLEVVDKTTKDHGEHILTKDEEDEADALNEDLGMPEKEEEVTEDELEAAELEKPQKKPLEYDDEFDDDLDVDEEKVE
jgi:replication factor A1